MTPRRRWLLLVPFVLLLALAIAWTGLWFHASARAQSEIAAWRQREAASGRRLDCSSQSITGYPFRVEWRCRDAAFELAGQPAMQLRLPLLLAVTQVYAPTLLISELTGPLEIGELGRAPSQIIGWKLGQVSLRGLSVDVARASIVLDAPTVQDADAMVLRAQRLELYGRRAAASAETRPAAEIVLRLVNAVADKLHPLAAKPINADVTAVLHGVIDVAPKAWPARLKEWQEGDGRLEIVKARISQDDVLVVGAGALRLTPRGALDGNLQVTVVGLERLLRMLDIERVMSQGQIGATIGALDRLIPGLGGIARQNAAPGLVAALGQRTLLEEQPAVTFPVRLTDGVVFFGPFRVGELPALL
jgi:hypothetical protein